MGLRKVIENKIFWTIVVAIIIVSFSFVASRPKKDVSEKTAGSEAVQTTREISLNELVNKDSDKDRVKDWEEELWGTDPYNPDTLGRGFGDLAEINKKRATLPKTATDTKNGNLTETDAFTQQLFASIMALKQDGSMTDETMSDVSSSIVENLKKEAEEKQYYALSDLKIVPAGTSSVISYQKDMARVAKKYSNAGLGKEITALAKAVDKKDSGSLKGLDKTTTIYRHLLDETLSVTVPKNLAPNHLIIVNSYRNIIESLGNAEKIFSDPIVGLVEVARYRNSSNLLILSLAILGRYFEISDTIIRAMSTQVN